MVKKEEVGISVKKEENFSKWYNEVVQKAELADYSNVKGFMVIRPRAYEIWEKIQEYFNKRLKRLGVKNAYFPLFIPESFFKKEAEHAKGFKPEVAWISNVENERLAVRPTSETIIYDSYKRWIRSWRDLPLRINQWCNIVRWETKATRLFLRTREFLWQEGHCVYESKEECDKETLVFLEEYKKLCEGLLAIPVIMGKKSKKEKFAGALYSMSIEALMPDGKALQMGTSHNLGQNFAKCFNISYLDKSEKRCVPWQNSWGFSTRLIGALVMVHSDNKGLVIPPRLACIKIVIVPILFERTKERVLKEANKIKNKLRKYGVLLDDRKEYTPGWKFNEWELKGVPIRLEIGPKDLEKKRVVLVRRDNYKKENVKVKDLEKVISKVLDDIQKNLFNKAKKFLEDNVMEVKNWQEFVKAAKKKKLIKAKWCNRVKCEDWIRDKVNGVKSVTIPFDEKVEGKCVCCGKDAEVICYFGKTY